MIIIIKGKSAGSLKGHKCARLRRLRLREEFIKFESDPEHTPDILYVSRKI